MPRVNIYLNDKTLLLVDKQAKERDRSRSAQLAELIKSEDRKKNKG